MAKINNTDAADVNEIQMGFFLAGGWTKFDGRAEAKRQLETKSKKIGPEATARQTTQAKDMADEVLKWAKLNGYSGRVKKVWWTARPGILSRAVGYEVESRKNPTDVLVQFSDGEFLGVSAKSTKTQGDIGFKNPGLGTVEKALGLQLKAIDQKAIDIIVKEFGLSKTASTRKKEIRAGPVIQDRAQVLGTKVLSDIRNALFKKLSTMNNSQLKKYILDDWMDAEGSMPRYIKVTGMKVGAKVEDPINNEKITALSSKKIKLTKVGNDSVGIQAGSKRIMKMRSKYESQKLGGSIKFTGDPWK